MTDEPLDDVFKALADPTRRTILDLLRDDPGLNVSELTEHFEVTRYAVMKHLDRLEESGLVVSRRDGRSRRLYLNPMPIRRLYERWLSKYSAAMASGLSNLKRRLEEEPMSDLRHVFQLYIRTTPETLWRALTDPEQTERYYFGTRIDSTFDPGAALRYLGDNGEPAIEGEVVESVENERLVHTFDFPHNDDPPSRVSFEIEPMGDELVKLTVTHAEFDGESETYHSVGAGWPMILNALKSYLETGEALAYPDRE